MKRILSFLLVPLLLTSLADAAVQPKRVLRIIAFGAHPDDAEFQLGGCAIKWAQLGHKVKLVCLTRSVNAYQQPAQCVTVAFETLSQSID